MNNAVKLRWFILMPGLAMWLGWGIRGQIGPPTGVMIPGTFLALTLCVLLSDKQFSRGLLIALTAVGFGFGGDMTTLQTAGIVMGRGHPAAGSLSLSSLGLAIKGALWALFGGACLGLALASSRYWRKDIVLGVIFMLASFYVGWALIDRPKLVYFSANRPEIWGGLVFGAVAFLSWLTLRGHTRIALVLALCGVVAGGVGYPVAVTVSIPRQSRGHWFVSRSKRLFGVANAAPSFWGHPSVAYYQRPSWSKRLSSSSCFRMYSRTTSSYLPTVDTKYPRAQKCCPTKLRFLSP